MDETKTRTTPWDAADYIETPEDVVEFLQAALEENDPAVLTEALGVVARAKGMTAIAQRTGLSRESLYRTLSAGGNPGLATLFKIMDAMDLRLEIRAKQADSAPA